MDGVLGVEGISHREVPMHAQRLLQCRSEASEIALFPVELSRYLACDVVVVYGLDSALHM